jgi:RHS repeat-associated protein
VFTYVNDHHGMPKELIGEDGRVAWSTAHSAWGEVVEVWRDPCARRAVETPFRMLGQYLDEETGLCYTRFRYFDAKVGRWISPDPLGVEGGENLFGWDGSPTNHVDPLGMAGVWKTPQQWADHDHDRVKDELRPQNRGFEPGRHDEYPGAMRDRLRQMAKEADARGDLPEYGERLREIANTYDKRAREAHRGGPKQGCG